MNSGLIIPIRKPVSQLDLKYLDLKFLTISHDTQSHQSLRAKHSSSSCLQGNNKSTMAEMLTLAKETSTPSLYSPLHNRKKSSKNVDNRDSTTIYNNNRDSTTIYGNNNRDSNNVSIMDYAYATPAITDSRNEINDILDYMNSDN